MILNVFLDFDGVVHPMTEQFHQAMKEMEEADSSRYGKSYFDKNPNHCKIIDNKKIFWLPYYFTLADKIGDILSKFDNRFDEIRLIVHSAWRGLGDVVIGEILKTTNLHKYYKGILPLHYNSQSRLINILGYMEDHCPKNENHTWIAFDDLDDLFHHVPEHFIKCESEIGFDEDCASRLIKMLAIRNNLLLVKSLS